MTNQQRELIGAYLGAKDAISGANDALRRALDDKYLKVPPRTPQEAGAAYQASGSIYTGDPLYGVGDIYIHPERVEYAIVAATKARNDGVPYVFQGPIDCDDIALWARASIHGAEVGGSWSSLYTVIDAGIRMCHVVCAGAWEGQPYMVDTNGYRELRADTGVEIGILEALGGIYSSASYIGAVKHRGVFDA